MAGPTAKITISLVDKTKKGFNSITKSLSGVSKALTGTAATVATLAGGAGFALLAKNALETGKELRILTQLSNANAESFQKYAAGANAVNISTEKFADILKDVNDKVGDFQQAGSGPLVDFFENIAPKIGLTADAFKNLSGPQALQAYFNGLEAANLSQSELTFFMEAIASDATALIPLLRANGKGFAEAADKAEKLGLVLSETDVSSLDTLAKGLSRVTKVGQGLFNRLLIKFSPVLIGIVDDFEKIIIEAGGFKEVIDKSFTFAIKVVGVFADGIRGIEVAFNVLKGVAAFVLGGIIGEVGLLVSGVAKLTGNEGLAKASKEMEAFGDASFKTFETSIAKADELASSILPSEVIKEKIASYQAFGDAVVSENARIAASEIGQKGSGVSEVTKQKQQEIKDKFALLKAESANELALNQEKLNQKLAQDVKFLSLGENQRIIGEQRSNELIEQMRTDHGIKMAQINKDAVDAILAQNIDFSANSILVAEQLSQRQETIDQLSADGKRSLAIQSFRGALDAASTGSKKIFEVTKKLALAEAVINGFRAIQSGFATSPFFPVGIAMGALAATKTAKQISSIKSQNFGGGGGGAPSVGGGSAPSVGGSSSGGGEVAPSVQGPTQQPKKAVLNVQGDLDSRDKVLDFAQKLVELRDDGFTEFDVLLGESA